MPILSFLALSGCGAIVAGLDGEEDGAQGEDSVAEAQATVELLSPASSPAFLQTPKIEIAGVTQGETVTLYSDEECSTELGSAAASGTSLEITLSSLVPGDYEFYLKAPSVNSGDCMATEIDYTLLSACPSGYLGVAENDSLSVSAFCVMQFEAKNNGSAVAVSQEETAPYTFLGDPGAWNKCDELNTEGSRGDIDSDVNGDGTYAMISNPEWMAVAHNLEGIDANWTGGAVGEGCLFRGNVGGDYPCDGVNSGYDGANGGDFGAGRSDGGTASLTLDSGEEIWDFSGNLPEFVDWDMTSSLVFVTSKGFLSSESGPSWTYLDFNQLDSNVAVSDVMYPASYLPKDSTLTSAEGVGSYIAGPGAAASRAATRGGGATFGEDAGIYALYLYDLTAMERFNSAAFRCVYRP